ncbi:tape measure protein [Barnesiella intestinihominis]|uniref:tape measure protein n=1 Tax=Barnesiella intestinihominis TaxID=487174 RepID=UPI002431ABB9|nr:tape measure protein [Barnesiella intestinihominis]
MAGLHFDITGDNSNFLRKLREVETGVTNTSKEIEKNGLGIEDMFNKMTKAAAAFGAGFTAKELIQNIIQARGEIQQLEVAFTTMLGSGEKANVLMAQLTETAAKTPFDLQGVANGARQLLAYGTSAEDVNETLIRLGNIAAGLSQPLGDLVYLYGTTMTQGRLYTQDLNQFTGRGIPMIKELAKEFGVAESEIKGMVEAGMIGFPEVQKVIQNLTNEGGMFFNLMQEQSKTITGQISNIGDSFSMMLNDIGKANEGIINDALSSVSYLIENYEKVGKILIELVGTYGAYRTALITISAIENLRYQATLAHMAGLTKMQAIITVLKTKTDALNVAMAKNPYVAVAAAVAALGLGIYKLVTYQTEAEKALERLDAAGKESEKAALSEQRELAKLNGELSSLKEGTDEYNTVKEKIVAGYSKYYDGLEEEINKVGLTEEAYKKLTKAITDSYGARQYQQFKSQQEDWLDNIMSDNLGKIQDRLYSELGDKEGAKLYSEIYHAILERRDLDAAIQDKLNEIQDKGTIFADSRIDTYISNIREAQKITEDLDGKAREKFGVTSINTSQQTANEPFSTEGKSISQLEEEIKKAETSLASLKKALADGSGTKEAVDQQEAYIKSLQDTVLEREKDLRVINEVKTQISKLEKEQGETVSGSKEYNALQSRIDALRAKLPKTATGLTDINAYTDQLNRIKELRKKNASERIRLDTDLENQVEQARINAMEDGIGKEMAQRELNNKIELQDIERQKQEYIRKITEAQRQIFEAEENAKADKDKNYKKKAFDPSSVSVDTSMFDNMSEYTKQKQANETSNYYNNILAKYQDYTTKRLSVEKKYQNDLANLEKAGGTEEQKAELFYQRTEALNAIDKEFAMREVSFQTWANSITNMSLDELERLLTEAEQELARMENEGGTNGNELAVQRAKVTATKDRIANIKSKESTSPDKRSIKEWQELYKTLSKVEREFEELGDTIGGTVGEIISAAGSISSSTLQMIDGIVTLANSSSTAMSGTAEAASTAIQNVEKASVILSIVGAALQVATKIVSLFRQESSYEKYEEAKEVYESYIDILDQIIEKQLELADSLAGENAQAAYDKAIELYKKQADSARVLGAQYYKSRESGEKSKGYQDFYDMSAAGWQQAASALGISAKELAMMMSKNMTNLFNLPVEQLEKLMSEAPLFIAQLDSEAQEYIKQIIEAENNIKSTAEREMENATGISFESFSDDILESLYDVEKGAEDIADDIADYMRKALIKAMYVKQYEPEMRKWYEMWAEATKDGEIDPEEQTALDNLKNSIIQGAEAGAAAINAQFGTGSTTEQKSTAGGFETMSQDTATELNGRFAALQLSGEEIKNQMISAVISLNSLLSVSTNSNSILNNILNQHVITNSYLEDIAKYTKPILEFGDKFDRMISIFNNKL